MLHRVGDSVGVQNHLRVHIAGRPADRLHQRRLAPQKAFFVRIQNRHQRNFRQIEPFAQQIHADERLEMPLPQIAQQLHPLERIQLAVQPLAGTPCSTQIGRQVLGQPLGQRRHQHPLFDRGSLANLPSKCGTCPRAGETSITGSNKPGRPNDLLDDFAARLLQLVFARRRADEHHLVDLLLPLLKLQRPVVERARQPEAVLDERLLPAPVAVVHRPNLRHGDVRLIDDHQKIFGKKLEQRIGRASPAGGRDSGRL